MPLYEFECQKCHHRFEKIQSLSAPDPECPQCGSKVQRLLSAPAVQFKGTGWYVTDYAKSGGKSDSKPADNSDSSSSTSKSESKSESKGESGPEAKSTTKSDTKSGTSSKE